MTDSTGNLKMTSQLSNRSRKAVVAILAGISVLGISHVAMAVDQVTLRSSNVTVRGEITAMTTASVSIKPTNGPVQEVPVSDIFNIIYDMQPPMLAQAQSNERSGSLDSALQKYQDVAKSYAGDDKRVVTDVKFLIARTQVKSALADPSKVADAQKAIAEFRTANKTHFRYLEATLLEAQLLSENSATEAAAQDLLREVQSAPVKGFQLQAGVQLGRLLLKGDKISEALAAFDQVIQQSAGDAGATSAMFDGMLGKASCQQKQGQVDDAIKTLDEVISKASESESQTLAEAWVQKGDCFRAKNLPKDALMAYLHVDVLYASEPAAHAESLFRLASLWGPAGHQDRADEAMARLTSRYENSPWAKQSATPAP
jgi:tetratricopeptide (TPR) repeat protein